MKTHCVATFNALAPALVLCQQLQEAGINAIINDESILERFWFMSEPLAAIHVEVKQPDYLPARKLVQEWENSRGVLKDAVRCPEGRSGTAPDRLPVACGDVGGHGRRPSRRSCGPGILLLAA